MASNTANRKFHDALNFMEQDGARRDVATVKSSVNTIQHHAETHGLHQDDMLRLVKICDSAKFNAATLRTLIRTMIPKESVPEEAIVCALSKISAGKCTAKIQELLLRWIILVFDIINTKSRIHSLYGILFNYIGNDGMAPDICHLLFLLTRRSDVTHFRIASLIKHQRQVGSQPHIAGLLSVYRLYQPSLIIMSSKTRAHFRRRDKEWSRSIYRILSRFGPSEPNLFLPPAPIFTGKNTPLLPEVKPSVINNGQAEIDQPISQIIMGKVHINEIKSFEDVLKTVGNLSLPRQASSLLSSKFMQHILAISPDSTLMDRLSMWLHHRLYECLTRDAEAGSQGGELLKVLLLYTDMFQEQLTVCESFLYRYLSTWNGHDHADQIFKLITKLPLVHFDILEDFVLIVLQKLFVFAPNVQYRCRIISTLSELARNYIAVEAVKYKSAVEENKEQCPSPAGSNFVIDELDTSGITRNLITFIDRLIIQGLQLDPGSTVLLYCAGRCWSTITDTIRSRQFKLFVLPHFYAVYKSLFSSSWICVSNACLTLRNLMEVCTGLKEHTFVQNINMSRVLNRYLLDFHDTLWRRRTFHPSCHEDSIAFWGLDVSLVESIASHPEDLPVSSMLSIDKHPALLASTAMYLEILRMDSSRALTSEFVLESSYTEHLESKGLTEIVDFVKSLTGPSE